MHKNYKYIIIVLLALYTFRICVGTLEVCLKKYLNAITTINNLYHL